MGGGDQWRGGPTLARMSGEMRINRWRVPLLVGGAVVLAAAIAVGVGVLIAHDQGPRPTPAAFASSAATPSGDPHARKACELNREAYDDERLNDGPVVLRISHEADASSSPAVRAAADELVHKQADVDEAEPSTILNLMTASLKMRTACIYEGYTIS